MRPRNLLSRLVTWGGAVALMAPPLKQSCTPGRLRPRSWLTDEERTDANVITGHRYRAVIEARRQSLSDLLRRSAARFGDKTAVVDGDLSFSFAELDAAATSAAAALQRRGIVKGDRLALLARNCWQYAVLSFASARLGVLLVPINFMLTADEVAFILENCEPSAITADDGLCTMVEEALRLSGSNVKVRGWIGAGDPRPGWENVAQWTKCDHDLTEAIIEDDDPIRIMYTSGTEARPKGVMLSSRALIAQYVSAIVDGGMSKEDIDLRSMPLFHCAQLDCFLGPDIYLGATSIILPSPQPQAVLTAIETHGVTKFFAPPTVWISLLNTPAFASYNLSSLHKGYYEASAMPAEVLREIQNRLPDLKLWNFYGQTELSPVATILAPEDQRRQPGSAGKPVLNIETMIVDDDDNPVPPGTVGEIVHRSPRATLGYWKDPDKTQAAFANGWFHTGDLGVVSEDGLLSVVDRKKDMIRTGRENVASREVEEAVYLHPSVAEVAVFGIPHSKWVEAVAAVIVRKPSAQLTADELRRHCAQHLAGFKVPQTLLLLHRQPAQEPERKDPQTRPARPVRPTQ